MLSIKALKPGNERYYLALALEDYYCQGGEPPGSWLGAGAAILGLDGPVTQEQLARLFQGYSPDRQMAPLVQNAGKADRQSGWDLTFSVPKTVSVLWSATAEDVRAQIEAAHQSALEKSVAYIEEHLAQSRVGKGGQDDVPARLVIAAFPHSTSRALDPQCHFHSLVLNVGVGPDARTRSIVSHPFYQNKMLLGALHRAELAHQLVERLGLALSRERTWFEVDGVPADLAREESTRRREVEEELGRLGIETASAAMFATLKTRRVKEFVPSRPELFEKWEAVARRHGLDEQAIRLLLGKRRPPKPEEALQRAAKEALRELGKEHSHFSKEDLLRALAEAPSALGLSVDMLVAHANKMVLWSNEIVSLGTRNGQTRYAARRMLTLEERLLATVQKLHAASFHTLADATVNEVVRRPRDFSAPPRPHKRRRSLSVKDAARAAAKRLLHGPAATGYLSHEQASAVAHITQGPRRISLLSGFAGTAKTTTLQAVREAFEAEGHKVIGASLSGKAARELSKRAGIPSTTIRMREREFHPTLAYQSKHHARQLYRAVRRWKTSRLNRLSIDAKTVLVVDEASMIGTRDMLMLTQAVQRGGGKLVLVGDKDQLPSIDAGGPFGSIAARIPPLHLETIVRQSDAGDRQAVKLLPAGKAHEALANYLEKGQLKLAETRAELFAELVNDWKASGGVQKPQDNIICAALNREVDELNDLAQALRLEAGAIDSSRRVSIRRQNGRYESPSQETLCVGDRVMVTKKSHKYGVENGDTGTLVGISNVPLAKRISVLFDGQSAPRLLPLRAVSLRRAYAFTTHKLQGATADNVFVAMTGPMLNRQMAYVQMSRHRETLNLYAPEHLAEKELLKTVRRREKSPAPRPPIAHQSELRSVLTSLMAKDAGKDLAHDVIKNHVPARPRATLSREEAERLLKSFAQRGEVETAKDARSLPARVIAAWQAAGGVAAPDEHQMFAATPSDRQSLNRLAQGKRKAAGSLAASRPLSVNGETFHVGDPIRFDAPLAKYRIAAGTIARIVEIGERRMTVERLDAGESITLPTSSVKASLAYALPTEDLSVVRPKTAHVLLSGKATDSQLSHVYHSLHRRSCRLYVDPSTAGPSLRSAVEATRPSSGPVPEFPQPDAVRQRQRPTRKVTHGL